MALEKWQPWKELDLMNKEMHRIWDEMFPQTRRQIMELPWSIRSYVEKGVATPVIDIIDKDTEILVTAEMPGVSKEGLEISYQDDTLTLSGSVKKEAEVREEEYVYSERRYSSFSRSIKVPSKINPEKISAAFKDGILTVHLPKVKEAQTKKIKVEVG